MNAPIHVLGVGVWTPQTPTLDSFVARLRDPAAQGAWVAPSPVAQLLPARMRGRASPLTAMFADVVAQATRSAGVQPGTLASVYGSAYGEMTTTRTLLAQVSVAGAPLSPAKFQASVHNTAAAQLSIALRNPNFSTSLAAGHDTVAMTFLEAVAFLRRNPGQVLLACADEAPSEMLQPGLDYPPLAAAFVLDNVAGWGLARIDQLTACEQLPNEARLRENPVNSALALAAAVFATERVELSLNEGAELGVRVAVQPQGVHG